MNFLGFAFKPGPGSNLANSLCLSCHSEAYVSTQPPLNKAVWTAEILKISPQSVMRDWKLAKAWLTRELTSH